MIKRTVETPEAEVDTIGKRIKRVRGAVGLSQQALAQAADVSMNGIARLEQDSIKDPHLSQLRKIAAALGVSVAALVEEELALPKAEAPETGRAVTPELAALVDGMAEAGDEVGLDRLRGMLEAERIRLGVARHDHPENPALEGEFARAVERLAYVGLRLEALRQTLAEQGAKALVEEA